jgi:hypothetical protein
MIDGSYLPHRTQEHWPSTRRSAGTSEEEHFEIELVVPESPTAQDSPAGVCRAGAFIGPGEGAGGVAKVTAAMNGY